MLKSVLIRETDKFNCVGKKPNESQEKGLQGCKCHIYNELLAISGTDNLFDPMSGVIRRDQCFFTFRDKI